MITKTLEAEIRAWTQRHVQGSREHARRRHDDIRKDAELLKHARFELPRFAAAGMPVTAADFARLDALVALLRETAARRSALQGERVMVAAPVAAERKAVARHTRMLDAVTTTLCMPRRAVQFARLSRRSLWGEVADLDRRVARLEVLLAASGKDAKLAAHHAALAASAELLRGVARRLEALEAHEALLDLRDAALHALLLHTMQGIARWGRLLTPSGRKIPARYRLPNSSRGRDAPRGSEDAGSPPPATPHETAMPEEGAPQAPPSEKISPDREDAEAPPAVAETRQPRARATPRRARSSRPRARRQRTRAKKG